MKPSSWLNGQGMKARALRGTGMTVLSTLGNNVLRLGSNLVLTRLLAPEIFGLMALVNVFLTGLKMFSDTGATTSIVRSPRGDEEAFLNTAWTFQIGRSVLIWLGTCLLALPAAAFYEEPMLAQLLPVAGLGVLLAGFTPTKVSTANRHLLLGRVTAINLSAQLFQVIVIVTLAWIWPSAWSLVIGGLIGTMALVWGQNTILPGNRNRIHWEPAAAREIFSFGKFIFLATGCSFLIDQSDRMILGAHISLTELGVYSVGYMLGTLPMIISAAINGSVVLPLFRQHPTASSAANRAKMFKVRRIVTFGSLMISFAMACSGVFLVSLLYDDRYALAGPIVVLLNLCLVPRLVMAGQGAVLLAVGDSRAHFFTVTGTAALQTGLMLVGVLWMGIVGVLVATFLANLLILPLTIYFLRRYRCWDPLGDSALICLGLLLNGLACWWHWAEILKLFP